MVGIYSKNRPEWLITALGCQAHAMPIVPLYDTLGPNAAEYIINHAELSVVVVGKENLPSVRIRIILIHRYMYDETHTIQMRDDV
jgi:long-chain acyl-CoA synthetase